MADPTKIEIIWPNRRTVDAGQIQRWACDDLYNEEGRSVDDWRAIPLVYALAIVDYYGGVTLSKSHGLDLPNYTRGGSVPGVSFLTSAAPAED